MVKLHSRWIVGRTCYRHHGSDHRLQRAGRLMRQPLLYGPKQQRLRTKLGLGPPGTRHLRLPPLIKLAYSAGFIAQKIIRQHDKSESAARMT